MDFSSLVLMEKDKETGYITKELGSFEVNEGALYVTKLFVLDNEVNLYFDTNKDVEEWEYSAIYDLFNKTSFEEEGFRIEEDLDEYNPTFIVKFEYSDNHAEMNDSINKVVEIIEKEMKNAFTAISDKEDEYKD
ncbi:MULTISPECIES: DUF6762 family protein [Clostridium]|uniref:DUF1292 domain-containing protein n=1 Tax=Clostridium cibarium TaxID=2762247 RepID=A0ABR8PNZ6_9CLOT|nr:MULTISPECIES: DUF6762 family protein [Clostridium]MBD7909904.1 hypothetical protein [Clostridium cibarium]